MEAHYRHFEGPFIVILSFVRRKAPSTHSLTLDSRHVCSYPSMTLWRSFAASVLHETDCLSSVWIISAMKMQPPPGLYQQPTTCDRSSYLPCGSNTVPMNMPPPPAYYEKCVIWEYVPIHIGTVCYWNILSQVFHLLELLEKALIVELRRVRILRGTCYFQNFDIVSRFVEYFIWKPLNTFPPFRGMFPLRTPSSSGEFVHSTMRLFWELMDLCSHALEKTWRQSGVTAIVHIGRVQAGMRISVMYVPQEGRP